MSSSINAVLGCLQTPLPHPESTAAAQISKCMSSPRDGNSGSPTNHTRQCGARKHANRNPFRSARRARVCSGTVYGFGYLTSHHITSHPQSYLWGIRWRLHCGCIAAALLACVTVQLQSARLCSAMTELLAAHYGYIRRRWAGRACDREKTQEN
jgi:hypothetical protein